MAQKLYRLHSFFTRMKAEESKLRCLRPSFNTVYYICRRVRMPVALSPGGNLHCKYSFFI